MEKMTINQLPSRTWNRLGVNETTIDWDESATVVLPEESAETADMLIASDAAYARKRVTIQAEKGTKKSLFQTLRTAGKLHVQTELTAEDGAEIELTQLVAPGAEVVITPDDPASVVGTALGDRVLVPLRAIAHIRKAGLVIENLEAYLTRPAPVQESAETSLRLMHTQRVALIDGQAIDLSPQVYLFLKILEDADGDEVHKRHIAEGLGLEPGASFRTADIFKRHKQVYATFVDKDDKGHYWLKPEFVPLERR